jgi:hypothetical protein
MGYSESTVASSQLATRTHRLGSDGRIPIHRLENIALLGGRNRQVFKTLRRVAARTFLRSQDWPHNSTCPKRLAAGGAAVVLTTRTDEKGQKALEQVKSYLSEKQIQNQSVYFLTLNMDDFESVQEYEGWASYSRTKLENVMFARELQNRADAAGLDWFTTVPLHPGLVGTDIWRYSSMGTKTVKNKREEKRAGNGIDSLLQFRTTD